MAFEPTLVVSARTGEGIEELRRFIADRARSWAPRASGDLFRLPVDRAFSLAGVGTVVTGTAWSGRIRSGDEVVLLPGGSTATGAVAPDPRPGRGAKRAGRCEPRSGLVGIAREEVESRDSARRRRRPLDAHHGARRRAGAGRLARPDRWSSGRGCVCFTARRRSSRGSCRERPIAPGQRGLARLALEAPVVARGDDRFVIRSYSPVPTIGGGIVLDPLPPLRRPRWPARLQASETARRVVGLVERRPAGVPTRLLPVLLGLTPSDARAAAAGASELREVGGLWVPTDLLTRTATRCLDLLRRLSPRAAAGTGHAARNPAPIARAAPEPVVEAVLDELRA